MSHHIHMLPQIVPLDRPLRPDRKKRLRKVRGSTVSSTSDVDDIDPLDEVFGVDRGDYLAASSDDFELEGDLAGLVGTSFSGSNMKELLQAQEDT